jgi:hypothetical protein
MPADHAATPVRAPSFWSRSTWVALCLTFSAVSTHAQTVKVQCGDRDSCSVGDTLTVTPASADKKVSGASLVIQTRGQALVTIALPDGPSVDDKSGAKAFQLDRTRMVAAILERMQQDPKVQAAIGTIVAKQEVADLRVVSTHAAAASASAASSASFDPASLKADLNPLWASGDIKPVLHEVKCASSSTECRFGDTLSFVVPGLKQWWPSDKHPIDKMVLTLNGVPLKQLPRQPQAADPPRFSFELQRGLVNGSSVDAWSALLADLDSDGPVRVSLSNDKGDVLTQEHSGLNLKIDARPAGITMFFVAFLVFCTVVALRPSFLRDPPPLNDMSPAEEKDLSLSLGRAQMFFWTVIVLVSWFYLWRWTESPFSINETALVLIGISVATAVGASAQHALGVDLQKLQASKEAEATHRQTDADANATLALLNAATPSDASAIAAATAQQATAQSALAKQEDETLRLRGEIIAKASSRRSLGSVWSDLTHNAGENETGLHRVQNIAFTLLMGFAFVSSVIEVLAMPHLPETALALMGISGGAYVGFKFLPAASGQ